MKSSVSRKSTKRKVLANWGPWDGKTLLVGQGGTMVFKVGQWHGQYDSKGVWSNV